MKTKSKSLESRSENAKFPTGIEERIRQRAYESGFFRLMDRPVKETEWESECAAIKLDASKMLTEARIQAESADEKKVYQLLKAQYDLAPSGFEKPEERRKFFRHHNGAEWKSSPL